MTRLARLACVWLGVALAVWLLPASIQIVDWTADGPARVALFAPLWQLAIALAAVAVLVVAIDTVITPLALLWLWVVPYLPWIPDRAPALLALAGPLRWAVLALALAGCASAAIARTSWNPSFKSLPGRRAVFVISLALYLGAGLWSASAVGPGADEPHYLVITQSLLRDHDLAIENNHTRGDYREYFGGELRPDFLRRGLNDVIYSIHAPGLPALLVPAYAIGGYTGAVVMLCLFGALAAVAVFDLALLLTGPSAAFVTWAAVCLTVPFVPHSWLIFPEMPGALLTAWAALWLHAPLPARARTWIWRGLALALLPWLHTKFVILLVAMIGALVLRLWRNPKAAAALVTPAAVSVALWIVLFYRLYGVLDPQIPYGDFPKLYVLASNIPRGLLGLLFDQKFGLLIYAPVYLVVIAGASMTWRRPDRRLFAAALLATVGAFVASSTRMYMWWGGSSAPARFLVPVLPLVAPFVAVAFHEFRGSSARTAAALLLAVSLAIAVAGVVSPQRFMLFSAPHGFANLVTAAQGAAPLTYLLPTFTEGEVREPLVLFAPWGIAALLAFALVVLVPRPTPLQRGFTTTAAGLALFVVVGAVLAGAPAPSAQRRATAQRGRLAFLRAFDGDALRGFDYTRRATLGEPQLLAMGRVQATRADGELADDPRRLAGPFDLPAGRFTARLQFAGVAGGGDAMVVLGDTMPIARGEAGQPLVFDLPFDASVWVAVSDGSMAASAQQVAIAAESIVPRSARPVVEVHAIEPIDAHPLAYTVYADAAAYPEGGVFWTKGTRAARLLVAPAGASTLVLTLHVGPAGGAVRVVGNGQDRSVTLTANQTLQIEAPLPPSARLVPLVVEASGEFRPSDHEPGSTDRRWLGVQVRIGLR